MMERTVTLPCDVGDMVYHVLPAHGVRGVRVKRFQIGKYGVLLVDFYGCFKTEEIGKTIFFNREEAEAKWAWKDE